MANREEIQSRVDIMQAWLGGAVVQHEDDGGFWNDLPLNGNASFNFDSFVYRIKPEPKDIWVNEAYGIEYIHPSEEVARSCAAESATRVAVHYREVMGDE